MISPRGVSPPWVARTQVSLAAGANAEEETRCMGEDEGLAAVARTRAGLARPRAVPDRPEEGARADFRVGVVAAGEAHSLALTVSFFLIFCLGFRVQG